MRMTIAIRPEMYKRINMINLDTAKTERLNRGSDGIPNPLVLSLTQCCG